MKKKNFLIIGLGNIGSKRLEILVKNKIYNKIYIFDIIKMKLKFKKKNIIVINKLNKKELNNLNLDLAILSVNPQFSFKYAKLLLNEGINVLVEKPPFFKFKQYKLLYNLSLKKNKYLFVGFNFLYDPVIQLIKKKYLSYIGKLYKIEMSYLYGTSLTNINRVGSFMDIGLHLVSIINYLLKDFKVLHTNFDVYEKKYNNYDEDGTVILKKGKINISLNFSLINWINKFHFKIIGSKGMIETVGLGKWKNQKLKIYKRILPSGHPKLIKSHNFKEDLSFEKETLSIINKIDKKKFDNKENKKFFKIMKQSYQIIKKQEKKISYFT